MAILHAPAKDRVLRTPPRRNQNMPDNMALKAFGKAPVRTATGTHSGAFSGFSHGGIARGNSFRGQSSFGAFQGEGASMVVEVMAEVVTESRFGFNYETSNDEYNKHCALGSQRRFACASPAIRSAKVPICERGKSKAL